MTFPTKVEDTIHRPAKRSLNDDIRLEAYKPDALAFVDKQMKGIHEAYGGCKSMGEHVERATEQSPPWASEIYIPKETRQAAEFVATNEPRLIAGFRDSQIAALERMVKSAAPHRKKWDGFIDPSIIPAAGKIQILALRHLARFLGLGGSKWMGQFAVGFPTTGDLSRNMVFPRKEPKEFLLPRRNIPHADEARFRERAPKSGRENAADLRKEAMGQHSKGWLEAPAPWTVPGDRLTFPRAAII